MAQRIRGLPDHIAEVPEDGTAWLQWREDALLFREWCRRVADDDPEKRAYILQLAANDVAFDMLVFGCIFEPRRVTDQRVTADGEIEEFVRPQGWYPWVPYPFQVEMVRFIDGCLDRQDDPLGRGDGVIEKSRDMGATWVFCFYVASKWRHADDFIAGLFSRKEDMVESKNQSSMFYRIEANLGLNSKIPETCRAHGTIFDGHTVRPPDWLVPAGYEAKIHNTQLNLLHPTKTNEILGEATTSRSGVGTRTTMNVLDEAAKIDDLLEMWSIHEAVTDHRFALSSADRQYGDGMYLLATQARLAAQDPTREGPALMTLDWRKHPLRDAAWAQRRKARFASDGDLNRFAREYEIDWDAGMGDWVYPAAKTILPGPFPYELTHGDVFGQIDPGLRDPTAIVFHQYVPVQNRYRCVEALTLKTPNAEYLAPILMGFPPGHPARSAYVEQAIHEVMDFTWLLRQQGRAITWIGDTYGDNAGGSGRESFYEALLRTSRELSKLYPDLPPVELVVMTKYDEGARFHRKRKECLTSLLPRYDFDDTPRVRYVLEAIQTNRYKSQEDGRLVMNEPNSPAHDWSSHPTSACEYGAVWFHILDLQRQPMTGATTAKARKRQQTPRRTMPAGYRRL
jgi:hypothetical protein